MHYNDTLSWLKFLKTLHIFGKVNAKVFICNSRKPVFATLRFTSAFIQHVRFMSKVNKKQ